MYNKSQILYLMKNDFGLSDQCLMTSIVRGILYRPCFDRGDPRRPPGDPVDGPSRRGARRRRHICRGCLAGT